MKNFLKLTIALALLTLLAAPVEFAWGQDTDSATIADPVNPDAGLAPDPASSMGFDPVPQTTATTPAPVTEPRVATPPKPVPPPTTSAPLPTVAEPTAEPASVVPESSSTPSPESRTGALWWVAVAAVVAAVVGIYKLAAKSAPNQASEEDEARCWELKKRLEQKLQELTDLRSQLQGKAVEKGRGVAEGVIEGTKGSKLLTQVKVAEQAYEALQQLYTQCIATARLHKRVFIVHGWEGYPEEGWFPWLKKELTERGYEVFVPQLPDTANPRIHTWVPALAAAVGTPDQQTYFVGHSMGCQTIARYLATLPEGSKVGGAVFVAGFFKRLSGLEDNLSLQETRKHWLGTPIDLGKVKAHLSKSVAIFSDNDPWVPLDNQEDFKSQLGAKVLLEHGQGHFSGPSDNVTELPVALASVLEL